MTLAFAEVFRVLANATQVTGGAAGILIRLQENPANFQFAERGTFLWVARRDRDAGAAGDAGA